MESLFGLLFLVLIAVWVASLVVGELRVFHHKDWTTERVLETAGAYLMAWILVPAVVLVLWASFFGIRGG